MVGSAGDAAHALAPPSADAIRPRIRYAYAAVRRTRFIVALTAFSVLLLVFAPGAFAAVRDHGGQGWAGEVNDKQITNIMFFTIAFFPAVILAFSLIQWRLDKRKHAREDAQRARAKSADWRGGW
jgi:hypothetical protein